MWSRYRLEGAKGVKTPGGVLSLESVTFVIMDVEGLLHNYQDFRSQGMTPTTAWERLRELYSKGKGIGDVGQGWRSISGKVFERVALTEMNAQLSQVNLTSKLRVASWSELPEEVRLPLSERLWVRGELTPVEAESHIDVAAYEVGEKGPVRVLSAYSCKVSLRERFQQDFFGQSV